MSDVAGPVTSTSTSARLLQASADLGVSDWLSIDPEMNQAFADVTRDPVAMQIDGQSYAHGFLTLSLLSDLIASALQIEGSGAAMQEGYLLNYGFNRMRLIEPIPLGARIRGHFKTADSGATQRGEITVIPIDVQVEIEDIERPALVGEWLLAWRK